MSIFRDCLDGIRRLVETDDQERKITGRPPADPRTEPTTYTPPPKVEPYFKG